MNSLLEDSGENEAYPERPKPAADPVVHLFSDESAGSQEKEPYVLSEAKPETMAETVRRSGLAWSAGIALFGSVVFMMIIGWFADLLFGSSPWGLVGGIVVGSLIGFVQFFRITSQIFRQ